MSLLVLQGDNPHRHVLSKLPGLLLLGVMTLGVTSLAAYPAIAQSGFGSLSVAIIAGILIGNSLYPRWQRYCDDGVHWSKHHLLRLGIILYGFRLSMQDISTVGVSGLLVDIVMLTSTFFLASYLGRHVLGLDEKTTWLIGAGSSICGAAAILATAPTIKASNASVAVAVATVIVFGTSAMFLYPCLYDLALSGQYLFFSPHTFGVYIGSTVHEVAQVVAAGHQIAPTTEKTAVVGKMLRVMLLAPFLMVLGMVIKRRNSHREARDVAIVFPWFALGFLAVTAFNSLHWLPLSGVTVLTHIDNLLLVMAMSALGLTTRFSLVRQAGLKPLLLGLILFLWLIVGGAAINLAVATW